MLGRKATDKITVRDVPAPAFIKAYAEHLKKSQKVMTMENGHYVKTGTTREIAPHDENWFYTRCAALARKMFLRPCLGVKTLQHIFGKQGRNGNMRKHHSKGSGKIIRYALQQLEGANILMKLNDKRNKNASPDIKDSEESCFARIVTFEGQKELNEIAKQVFSKMYGSAQFDFK